MRPMTLLLLATVCSTALCQSPVQFRTPEKRFLPEHNDPAGAVELTFGDLDGDGDVDLWVAISRAQNGAGGQDRVYRNDGRGVFTDISASAIGLDTTNTGPVVLTDFDRDGDLDAVQGNFADGTPGGAQDRLWRNNGNATFVDITTQSMPADLTGCTALAAGDLDGDLFPDLVMVGTTSTRIYRNTGTGGFVDATPPNLPAVQGAGKIALGDLDGDQDLDLLVHDPIATPMVMYLRNDGSLSFVDVTATRLVPPLTQVDDFVLLDADGDGDRDLVTVARGLIQNRFYRNSGGVLADATGPALQALGHELVEAADVDQDGDQDLVLVTARFYDGPVEVASNDGTGNFAAAPGAGLPTPVGDVAVRTMALADVDGDGAVDVAVAGAAFLRGSSALIGFAPEVAERLLWNDGTGAFRRRDVESPLPDTNWSVDLGDYDGDGDPDVLLFGGQATRLLRNDGKRRFVDVTGTVLAPFAEVSATAFADYDGDGTMDLFLARDGVLRSSGALLTGTPGGAFVNVSTTNLPAYSANTVGVAAGDVDGDGDVDLVLGNLQPQPNVLLRNAGNGTFSFAPSFGGVSHFSGTGVRLADFDADGDLDYLNVRSPDLELYENDSSGQFTLVATLSNLSTSSIRTVQTGDLDGNGRADLFVTFHSATAQYLRATAAWTFLPAQIATAASGARARQVVMSDHDGDGDLDVAVIGDGNSTLIENRGAAGLVDVSRRWFASTRGSGLAAGDLDQDGDPDLVTAGTSPSRIWWNQQIQHTTITPAEIGAGYSVELSYRPGSLPAPALAAVFASTAESDQGLPPMGILGLDPAAMINLGTYPIPAPAGVRTVELTIANLPALRGVVLWSQSLIADGSLPATPLRLTNTTFDPIR